LQGSELFFSLLLFLFRQYATLYFAFWVDSSESELGILDLIQVVVEALDQTFPNVCELDIIFNMDKVHYLLDEVVMGGMVLETGSLLPFFFGFFLLF
jgi:AP-3 complex subunit sigma